MPGLDQIAVHDPAIAPPTSQNSLVLTEENLKFLQSPSPLSPPDHPQTKDSPLTDIGTSPPPFEIPSLGDRRAHSRDSYESSELSDLGDEESEAETDKMDFLNEDSSSRTGDKDTDLQRLSALSDLANLQELDSDDSDDSVARDASKSRVSPLNNANITEPVGNAPTNSNDPAKRLHALVSEASTEAGIDDPLSRTELDANKRRKVDQTVTPDDPTSDADANLEGIIKPDTNVVQEIVETGAEPLSWPAADSVVTAITPVDLIAPTDEKADALDAQEEPPHESEISLEIEAEDGASADVEDTVKQEQKEEEKEEQKPEQDHDGEKPAVESENDSAAVELEEEEVDLDEQRKYAIEELISIEKDFSFLRDKLYRDKLSLLEHEMQLCLDGSHPELLQIYYKVNQFYQDNIKLANATLNYSLKCINTETIATRTSIHQDFMKNLAGTRNEMITETTSSWYKINKEWNYLDLAVADYNFTAIPSSLVHGMNIPVIPGGSNPDYYQESSAANKKVQKHNTIVELVRQRNCINAQLGILDGLKEFHGIPSAVSNSLLDDEVYSVDELLLRRASPEEINEDLQAMGIY